MNELARKFLEFAEGTREDFHEPDEQGIVLTAMVGQKLDNAWGKGVNENALREGWQEAVIFLTKRDENGIDQPHVFNLADLMALAKIGAQVTLYE